MKKAITVILAAAMLLACGCGSGGNSDGNSSSNSDSKPDIAGSIGKAFQADGREYGKSYTAKEGETLNTAFFDFGVTDAFFAYDIGWESVPDEGWTFLCVEVETKNTFDEPIPIGVYDFAIWYGDGEDTWDFALEGDFGEGQYPRDIELGVGESVKGYVIFVVPDNATEFQLEYIEVWDDEFEGNIYQITITNPDTVNTIDDYNAAISA